MATNGGHRGVRVRVRARESERECSGEKGDEDELECVLGLLLATRGGGGVHLGAEGSTATASTRSCLPERRKRTKRFLQITP